AVAALAELCVGQPQVAVHHGLAVGIESPSTAHELQRRQGSLHHHTSYVAELPRRSVPKTHLRGAAVLLIGEPGWPTQPRSASVALHGGLILRDYGTPPLLSRQACPLLRCVSPPSPLDRLPGTPHAGPPVVVPPYPSYARLPVLQLATRH